MQECYSAFNCYNYSTKSLFRSAVDLFSTPLRRVCGGRNIDLIEQTEGQTLAVAERVMIAVLSIVLFPIGLVSAIALLIKKITIAPQERLTIQLSGSSPANNSPGNELQIGKQITRILPYYEWLDHEYSNKRSQNYLAYKELDIAPSTRFVGIKGDGNCGFRSIAVSLLIEIADADDCEASFGRLKERMNSIVQQYSHNIDGYDAIDSECLDRLNRCAGSGKEICNLLNDESFLIGITRQLRFLSNAIAIADPTLEAYGFSADYFTKHAKLDVDAHEMIEADMFASQPHIQKLMVALGTNCVIKTVDNGKAHTTETGNEALWLTLHLLCHHNLHFDVLWLA